MGTYNYSGVIALVIFVVILVIFLKKEAKLLNQEENQEEDKPIIEEVNASPLDLNDEDATVASLIAAIECRNETHKNVQVISVREVN